MSKIEKRVLQGKFHDNKVTSVGDNDGDNLRVQQGNSHDILFRDFKWLGIKLREDQ